MGTLTVRENLHFSASLRLPGELSKHERRERVEATLSDLGLFHVAESKVFHFEYFMSICVRVWLNVT